MMLRRRSGMPLTIVAFGSVEELGKVEGVRMDLCWYLEVQGR
jgi:hypothetical protein